jgi:hypothetical protein
VFVQVLLSPSSKRLAVEVSTAARVRDMSHAFSQEGGLDRVGLPAAGTARAGGGDGDGDGEDDEAGPGLMRRRTASGQHVIAVVGVNAPQAPLAASTSSPSLAAAGAGAGAAGARMGEWKSAGQITVTTTGSKDGVRQAASAAEGGCVTHPPTLARTYPWTHTHVCIHTYIHTHVRTYTHTHSHTRRRQQR